MAVRGLGVAIGGAIKFRQRQRGGVAGKIRLKAKYDDTLDPRVVCAPYGWWQPCSELDLPGYDPLSPAGANINP